MYPAYTWTNSYPKHSAPNDHPRAKEIPFHMKMDPNKTLNSSYHQPWPYGANYYCNPVPHEYHGCYNHSYYGGGPYSFQPPYPHYPPLPPTIHTQGFYPPFPGAYPAYSIPPSHYSIEQQKYDYDKNNNTLHHCCGCGHLEDEKNSRIEPEEPEVDKKTSESLVPLFLKDSPYPVMWVPPAANMNIESKTKDKDKYSKDPLKQGESGNGNHFPFPIFWLPYEKNEIKNDKKEDDLDLVSNKGLPDENKMQTRKIDKVSDSDAESRTSKHVVQKVIPVKQLGTNEEKRTPKSIETKANSDSVEKTDNGLEEGKASPKTSSKLPPVCLRIDPLPRKKNPSQSPSPPPGVKDRSKSYQQQTHFPESLKKEEEQSKGNIKTNEVTNKGEKGNLADSNVPQGEVKETEKKNLSEDEAALMIQSAYRGFEVTKSQPLTKLRQIGEVSKQVVDLRNRIQHLESSSTSTVCIDDKQKLIIGETIMSLLLKLDTIQGLHPIVRDVRKSVAKELVGLQEKLDSLTFVKSKTPCEETVSSNDQVIIHPEDDDAMQMSDSNVTLVDSDLGLCDNHEVNATESQDDGGAEAYNSNFEPQLNLLKDNSIILELIDQQSVDDVIHKKLDQALTQSDSMSEAADTVGNDGVEAPDIKPEPEQLVEHNTGELNNNQIQMSLETEKLVDNSIQEKSIDQALIQSDYTHEAVGFDTVIIFENQELEAIDYVAKGACDIKTEQLIAQNTKELNYTKLQMLGETEKSVDNSIQEKSDQVQAEFVANVETMESDTDVFDYHEVENAESYKDGGAEAGDIGFEPHVESETQQNIVELTNNQFEIPDTEQPQAQVERGVKNVESCKNAVKVEDIESRDVKLMETNAELELPKEDVMNGIQEDLVVPTEEAPKADDVESSMEILMEDLGQAPPLLPTRSHISNGGDRKLMEENEKLRLAVEDLLKAGNQQLGVIRELTARVEDLEKKLSKKNKKIKVNKCRSRRGCVVQDEPSDCLV